MKVFNLALILILGNSFSLAFQASESSFYKIKLLDRNFKLITEFEQSEEISISSQDIDIVIQDSNVIYLSVHNCSSRSQCGPGELISRGHFSFLDIGPVDPANQLYVSKGIHYRINVNLIEENINFKLSFKNQKYAGLITNRDVVEVSKTSEDANSLGTQLSIQLSYSPRFLEHVQAESYIRNFHLQEFATDGGFLGLTGMDKASIFREMTHKQIENNLGLVAEGKEIYGVHDISWGKNSKQQVVAFSCAMCHYGRAAGVIVPGLGNKNASPSGLAEIGLQHEETLKYKAYYAWTRLFLSEDEKSIQIEIDNRTKETLIGLQSEDNSNLTQGLTAVNQTPLRLYRDLEVDVPEDYPRAPSKAQSMWGLKEKRMHGGQFSDGGADGDSPLWAAGYDMGSWMSTEYMFESEEKLKKIQEAFGKLLPPQYPFEIELEKAQRGKIHFEKNCAKCHSANGNYERDQYGYPIYKAPKLIPHKYVKTEPKRMHLFDGLDELLQKHPLKKVLKLTDKGKRPFHGYYAPRLVGIWSRYPYLHNGSVPNLMALLTDPADRPKYFSLYDAGQYYRFDQKNLGLTLPQTPSEELELARRAAEGDQSVYDITRDEHSNEGHAKGIDLSLEEKYELIEYLKTL